MKSANSRSTSARRSAAAFGRKPALDHQAGAAADHVARRVVGNRRQALAGEDDVQGLDQVGRGVDQRAVEVENDGEGGHDRGYR